MKRALVGMAINCSVVSSAFDGQVVNYTLDTATGQMIGSAPGSMAPAGSGAEVTGRIRLPGIVVCAG